jgi:hypothetical protein
MLDENMYCKKNRKKKCNEGDNTTNEENKIQNRDYENIVETHKTVNKKLKIYEDRFRLRIEKKKKMNIIMYL